MNIEEKWIGEKDDTSGSYFVTKCPEIQKRSGGRINAKKLYKFNSRFGEEYYITDDEVIRNIEKLLEYHDSAAMYIYLYNLVIEKFGMIEFLVRVGHKIAEQRDEGYRNGKAQIQKDMRKLLGITE